MIALTGFEQFVLAGVGAGFTASGGYLLFRSDDLVEHGLKTTGTVTRLVFSSDYQGGTYAPEFQFDAADGSSQVVISSQGSTPCLYRVGQCVNVLYDPEDPTIAEINTVSRLWVFPGLFALAGLVMLGFAVGAWISPMFAN